MHKIILSIFSLSLSLSLNAQTPAEAQTLHDKGKQCVNEGKIVEGRGYTKQALDMRKKLFGEVNEDYITSLNNYALSFALEKDYADAVKYQEQAMTLCDKLTEKQGKPHKNYGLYALNMGRFYYLSDNMDGAVTYWEKALPCVEKYSEMYEDLLQWLAMIYSDRNDNNNLQHIMVLTEEHNQHELTKDCNEPKCMLGRANYYASKGNTAKAKECFMQVLSMNMDDKVKAEVYEAYAKFLANTKDWVSAGEYETLSANLVKKTQGKNATYANQLYMAALYCHIGKQYQQAIDNFNAVIEFYQSSATGETSSKNASLKKIADCQKGIGNAYSAMKEYAKACEAYNQQIAYYERYDKNSEDYPKAILRLAKAEQFNKDYDVSIVHHKQAMQLFDEKGMAQDYTEAASSLELCYVYAGKSEEVDYKDDAMQKERNQKLDNIIKDGKDNLWMTLQYMGKLTYARSLGTIAGCYAMKEDYANAIAFYKQYMEAIREGIREEFRMQSESERMQTWQEETKNIQELLELLTIIPQDKSGLYSEFSAIAYDAVLLSKGILLNSSIEFEKVIAQHGDKKLKELYEQIKSISNEISNLRKNKNAKSDADLQKILTLSQKNQTLQLQLYKQCAEFADFTNYISYNWKDVQKQLSATDIAIEFTAIKTGVLDNENIMEAIILTKDAKTPITIPICTLAEGKKMLADDYVYDSSDNLVWGKIRDYLSGKKRLFFSADGIFNNMGIEYLVYDGKPLSEQMEVYRLSTTKVLCYHQQPALTSNAVLFGDINYNEEGTNSSSVKRELAGLRGNGDVNMFGNLDNTKREISEIEQVLKKGSIKKVVSLSDQNAGKQAFLNLTDKKLNILHIATHGAYRPQKGMSDQEAMSSSILAFAGANLDEQGIVTAAEVAKMNLRECDLVALSACETGLGKLGTDGVFGLQRGFKNAGVHTLLMSLKNVYDASTAELMISFYRYFMAGVGKREALKRAQQDVRAKGYKDAKYWASFILLDAI